MQAVKFWHSKYLLCYKVSLVATLLFLVCTTNLFAQDEGTNMLDHDNQRYYFGMTAGLNNSAYKAYYSNFFKTSDSVLRASPTWSAGFQVGIAANLRLSPHSGLRLLPQFVLMQRDLEYTFKHKGNQKVVIESIMLHMPLHYKFCSDRINNFRFYAFTGPKFDYDFNSNTRSRRNDDILKIKAVDFGYDLGFGFDFYNSNYIFTPEIRISNGLGNVQFKDENILTSKVFDKLTTRMVFIGVIIGG